MPTPHLHTRWRTRASAALTVLGTTIAISLIGVPAHATTPTVESTSLNAYSAKVTSSTGKTLSVSLYNSEYAFEGPSDESISLATKGYNEQHDWSFPVQSTDLTLDSTGAGTLVNSSSEVSPYATVNLTITPQGSATQNKCNGQLESKTQPVTVTGTFFFDTKSTGKHKWGSVGSTTKTFTFSSSSSVTWQYETSGFCGGSATQPCSYFTSWNAYTSDYATSLYGEVEKKDPSMFASRSVQLSEPTGASRYDGYNASLKSSKMTTKGSKATLTLTGSGGSTTGSATLHGTGKKTTSESCGKGGKTKTKYTTWKATYKNGKSTLEAHPNIFGPISLKSGSTAEIDKLAKS